MNKEHHRISILLWLLPVWFIIMLMCVPVKVQAAKSNGYTYEVVGITKPYAIINDYDNTEEVTELKIPEEIKGYPVRKIGESAFRNHTELETVVIPDTVSLIDESAFYGCTNLETVDFGTGLYTIRQMAFANCTSLTEVSLPDHVTMLGSVEDDQTYGGVFYGCTRLTKVDLGDKLEAIPTNTFYRCSSLKSVTMPNSVKEIGDYAFFQCTSLDGIALSQSLQSIGIGAFYYCIALKAIVIPDSVTTISGDAIADINNTFGACSNLQKVVVGENVVSLPSRAFANCLKLTDVVFYGPTDMDANVFEGCNNLANAYYLSDVPEINEKAFGSGSKVKLQYPYGKTHYVTGVLQYHPFELDDFCLKAYFETEEGTITKHVVPGMPVSQPVIADKKGYQLIAWDYKDNSGDTYWNFDKNIFIPFYFTPVYEVAGYTITFQPGEGSLDVEKIDVMWNTKVGELPIPEREDYDFAGWYSGKNQTGKEYKSTTTMPANDVILYASWTLNPDSMKKPVLSLSEAGAYKAKLLWTKDTSMSGYYIYRATSLNGTYKKIGTASSKSSGYINGGLKPGKAYYYRVRSYKIVGGQKFYSPYSKKYKIVLSGKPDQPSFVAEKKSKTSTDLTWESFTDAGYVEVYYATSKKGRYNRFAVYTSNTTGCYHTKLNKGKTYYYKIRTYNLVNGKKVYSKYSKIQKVSLQ
ncbi:MAG: leucine-rich repeat protein [Lachnospiraceae bacterium]